MNFVRVTSEKDGWYAQAMELYKSSFPPHEQREPESQKAILRDAEYHFEVLLDGGQFAGEILYWETADFLYVEHFCIQTALRGKSYGQRALALLREKGKPVILEIDPPVDEIAVRRKHFYERAGYRENAFRHIHPPYHSGNKGHLLTVMSCPEPLSEAAYKKFEAYLRERVMAHCMEAHQ